MKIVCFIWGDNSSLFSYAENSEKNSFTSAFFEEQICIVANQLLLRILLFDLIFSGETGQVGKQTELDFCEVLIN